MKRSLDVRASMLGLVVLSPSLAVVALAAAPGHEPGRAGGGYCSTADVHAFLRQALPECRFEAAEPSVPEDAVEAPEAAE